MISILIPVYNFDVRPLVESLHKQASMLGVPFEIRCYDDLSYFEYRIANQRISQLPYTTYRELPENIGRSKIRNRLAQDAKYPTLLFLDCDAACEHNNFLRNYQKYFGQELVCCGGRSYSKAKPTNANELLHWEYGKSREVSTAAQRALKPYSGFQTNNFLIDKNLFQSIKLNEALTGYGHEDTLFGIELSKRKLKILHIDNPLVHIGLEEAAVFLEKAKEGVNNLAYLIKNDLANKEVKLYRIYKLLSSTKLTRLVYQSLAKNEKNYLDNLLSTKIKLANFDKLKLLWLIEALQHHNKEL